MGTVLIKEGLYSNMMAEAEKGFLEFQGCCFYDGTVKCSATEENSDMPCFQEIQAGYGSNGKLSGKIPIADLKGVYTFHLTLEDVSGKVLEKIQVRQVTITDMASKKQSSPDYENKNFPELEGITYQKDSKNKAIIILTYKNASGGMILKEGVEGFHIKLAPRFVDYGQITGVKTEGNKIILNTAISFKGPNDISLAYLSYEYPNEANDIITDTLGRPIPEMNMVRVVQAGFITPYINVWQVSDYKILKESFADLKYTEQIIEEAHKEVQFQNWYCELPGVDLGQEAVIYLAGQLLWEESDTLILHVGSLGECKQRVWFDKKEVPLTGNNEKKGFIKAGEGLHELIIALSPAEDNGNRVYVRLEKVDYPGKDSNIVKSHPKFPVFLRKGYDKMFL